MGFAEANVEQRIEANIKVLSETLKSTAHIILFIDFY